MPRFNARPLRPLAFLALCLALPLHAAVGQAAAAGFTAEQLMQQLSQNRSADARFTEVKHLAALEQPLELQGVVRYRPPATMEKEITQPYVEEFIITEDEFRSKREGRPTKSYALADYPVLQAFAASFTATMAGDLETLRRHYQLALNGNPARWTLILSPLNKELAARLSRIELSGAEGKVQRIETLQADGDRSVMSLYPLH